LSSSCRLAIWTNQNYQIWVSETHSDWISQPKKTHADLGFPFGSLNQTKPIPDLGFPAESLNQTKPTPDLGFRPNQPTPRRCAWVFGRISGRKPTHTGVGLVEAENSRPRPRAARTPSSPGISPLLPVVHLSQPPIVGRSSVPTSPRRPSMAGRAWPSRLEAMDGQVNLWNPTFHLDLAWTWNPSV